MFDSPFTKLKLKNSLLDQLLVAIHSPFLNTRNGIHPARGREKAFESLVLLSQRLKYGGPNTPPVLSPSTSSAHLVETFELVHFFHRINPSLFKKLFKTNGCRPGSLGLGYGRFRPTLWNATGNHMLAPVGEFEFAPPALKMNSPDRTWSQLIFTVMNLEVGT